MAPLRIGMVLADRASLPDIRVDKEARALIDAGHRVALLAGGDESLDSGAAAPVGVEVYRCDAPILSLAGLGPRPKPRLLLAGLRGARRDPRFWARATGVEGLRFYADAISAPWSDAIRRFLRVFRPQVLHVHDLLALPTALRVARGVGLPVVADLHENWPAYLEAVAAGLTGLERRAFVTVWDPARWRRIEAELLPLCAAVIVVVPEAAARLRAYPLTRDAVVLVSNTEPPLVSEPTPTPGYEHRWVALYAGSVDHARGLETILHATPEVAAVEPRFLLLVVGANPEWRERLTRLAQRLGVERHVEILGWRPRPEIPGFIAASQACLVPHRNLEHTNTTVPHKLFQYLAHGKPVVASSCPPLARILKETGAGVVFNADSAPDAARALIQLIETPSLAKSMGNRGRDAVDDPWGWRKDADRLCDLYGRIRSSI